jgi:hypothetical protein
VGRDLQSAQVVCGEAAVMGMRSSIILRLYIKNFWCRILMEHLLSTPGFQYSPLQTKVDFDPDLFEMKPVEHVIDLCVSHIFHEKFNGDVNLLTENVGFSYNEPYFCRDDENYLLGKFSQKNMDDCVKEIIHLRIAHYACTILKINSISFLLDQMEYSPDRIKFRVIAFLEDITKLTFVFQLIKQTKNTTSLVCDFRSELQTVCCCC